MIGSKFYKDNFDSVAFDECVNWCNETQQGTIENKGDYFECVGVFVPQPSIDELKTQLTEQVQAYMDGKAQERSYDNIASACSYYNSSVPKFKAEAEACTLWRDAVWSYCYEQLALFEQGEREIPTDIINELPTLEW